MLNLPISYICLRLGCIPESVVIVAIILSQCCFAARIYMLRAMINLNAIDYVKKVYLRILSTLIITFILPVIVKYYMDDSLLSFFTILSISFISACINILYVGCNDKERSFIYSNISNIKNKIIRR